MCLLQQTSRRLQISLQTLAPKVSEGVATFVSFMRVAHQNIDGCAMVIREHFLPRGGWKSFLCFFRCSIRNLSFAGRCEES